jgi:hypothetical protein
LSSQNQFLVTLNVDGIGNCGVWDDKTGGENIAAATRHRPGGMGPEQVFPALPTLSAIVLSRVYDTTKGDVALCGQLSQLAGRVYATVTEQPLDPQGNAFGVPRTFRGLLSSAKPGPISSDSNALRMWEVDIDAVTFAN